MNLINHLSSKQIMQQVIYATFPVILVAFFLFGISVIWQLIFAILTAIIIDVIFAKLYNKPLFNFAGDYSSILTAILLALSIPTLAPWWIIVLGVSFALIFAKYIYGGLGNNIFNPAMVGFCFLLISYPEQMSVWQVPQFIDFNTLFNNFDSLSGATLLDSLKQNIPQYNQQNNIFFIAIASILGGIYLLIRKIIAWHIPVFTTLAFISTLLIINFFGSYENDLIFNLFAGGFFFAIFFIATDPVSTCSSIKGKIIFAIMVGVLIAVIRTFANYPDGIAFAILISNMFVPLIDYLIKGK